MVTGFSVYFLAALTEVGDMRKQNPKRNAVISWIIMGIGALFAVIGAGTAGEYQLNGWLWMGFLTVIAGMGYHFARVRCPFCGHSLAGYRPIPKECPNCHRRLEE